MMQRCVTDSCKSRCLAGTFAVALAMYAAAPAAAEFSLTSGLISQQQAASYGLTRAWFARARVNPARSKVVRWILFRDQLLLVTNAGVVHALDANTGRTQWATPVGNPEYPSLGPTANAELVALINGSTLYLLDRADGRLRDRRQVGGAPGAGPALAKDYVFVPLVTGRIEGYPLANIAGTPWFYQSFGRALVPPRTTAESVVWSTDGGLVYVARASQPGIRFRLQSSGEFAAPTAYREPLIYAVSLEGELFAIDERLGSLRWKYLTGFPTDRAPAVVAGRLFVGSDEPMLHCVDAATGIGQWEAPRISQFAAVTKSHVYGVDEFGTVHVLNIADGSPVGRIPTGGTLTALVNDQTDRLFLISDSGLVQCLHEIGADEPTYYVERPAALEDQLETAAEEPAAEPATVQPTQPSPRPVPPQDLDDDPFGGTPFTPISPPPERDDEPPADEDPFGVEGNPFG